MIEYKVREVTRYIVTRWEGQKATVTYDAIGNRVVNSSNYNMGVPAKTSQHGEYNNGELAYTVAYALAKAEADRLGYGPGDDRIQYPEAPKGVTGEGVRF